jgi:L-ascorbate metabolism protein UlaG (beta-lactamase superfamily)
VSGHLSANPAARFISCQQTVELLNEEQDFERFSDRVIEMTPDSLMYTDTLINDIGVRVYRLVHGPYLVEDPETGLSIDRHRNIQNLGFLFDVGGVKVFHCGDSSPRCLEDYKYFRLDKEEIDVAIMGRGFLASSTGFGIEILRDLIKADHIILMHIHHDQNSYFIDVAKQVEDEFQSVTIFETLMDSKTFTVSH